MFTKKLATAMFAFAVGLALATATLAANSPQPPKETEKGCCSHAATAEGAENAEGANCPIHGKSGEGKACCAEHAAKKDGEPCSCCSDESCDHHAKKEAPAAS